MFLSDFLKKRKRFSLFLMFVGKKFQILGPRCFSESVPYFLVLIVLTSSFLLFGFQIVFRVKISFM